MDVWGDVHALLGERCTYSEAGPEAPSRGWSGGTYSSGVLGLVDRCTRGMVPEVNTEKRVHVAKQCQTVPNQCRICLVS